MDASKFRAVWSAVHPERQFGTLFGTNVGEKHYVQLKLGYCLRDPVFTAVMNRFKAECGASFQMIGDIWPDGKNEAAQAIKDAKDSCTAWSWTPAGGVVGHRVVEHGDGFIALRETIGRLESEMEMVRTTNDIALAAKDREIARLKDALENGEPLEEGRESSNPAVLLANLKRVRADRDRVRGMVKTSADKFKAEIKAKDELLTRTKEELSKANAAASEGVRARAMEAQLKKDKEALQREARAAKSELADCLCAARENEGLRAEVRAFQEGYEKYTEAEARKHSGRVVTDVSKIPDLKEAYMRLAAKASLFQSLGAEDRIRGLQREVDSLRERVAARQCEADAGVRAVCAELERKNAALVAGNPGANLIADQRIAALQLALDDARGVELGLRGQVHEADERLRLVMAEVKERLRWADGIDASVGKAQRAVEAETRKALNGSVHAQLVAMYTRKDVPRAEAKEWEVLHSDPVFVMGYDFGKSLLVHEQALVRKAEADVRAVELKRQDMVRQYHEVRARADKAEATERRATQLFEGYKRERAALFALRAVPGVERAARAILGEVKDALTLLGAHEGEVLALVEQREWCEVVRAKCGSLAGELRRRAQKVSTMEPEWRAEREFLLRCAPELESAVVRKV